MKERAFPCTYVRMRFAQRAARLMRSIHARVLARAERKRVDAPPFSITRHEARFTNVLRRAHTHGPRGRRFGRNGLARRAKNLLRLYFGIQSLVVPPQVDFRDKS